jgi:ketosteroid isomerase-like protein
VIDSRNLDVVRSMFAAWERGDFSSFEWAHPEIEWTVADGPSPGTSMGMAQAREGWRSQLSAWEALCFKAEEYRELEDDRVLVLTRASGRGKRSGLDLGQTQAHGAAVCRLRAGKVIKLVTYFDRERAFADLGLAAGTRVRDA